MSYSVGVRWVLVSVASVVATLEPVIAGALAYLLLGERLTLLQIVGGAAIISAVLLLRPREGQQRQGSEDLVEKIVQPGE